MTIKVKDLNKRYGNFQVISNLNIDFPPNRIHCIFGPSGCGKTTLVNILSGLTQRDSGDILGIEGKTFSYIFQEDRLLPWASVKENILFALDNRYKKEKALDQANKYLALVDLLTFQDSYPAELSGGMKQRAAIARAFAYGGNILIMDEPFKGLHLELKQNLMDYIINCWNMENRQLFFITHDLDEALYLAEDIYIFDGPPLQLRDKITISISPSSRGEDQRQINYYRDKLIKSIPK